MPDLLASGLKRESALDEALQMTRHGAFQPRSGKFQHLPWEPQRSSAICAAQLSTQSIRRNSVTIPEEILEKFRAGTRTEAVQFVINDSVRVLSGTNKKRTGTVVSVFSVEPVTTYLIEPSAEPWGDFQAGQSDLELIES